MARCRRAEAGLARLLPPVLLLAAAAHAAPAELHFALRSEPLASLDLEALRRAHPARPVRVFEPYEEHEARFLAFAFADVLDAVYGEAWREGEELVFRCRDGYQPSVPVARVLEHRAWLAFDRLDGQGFSIWKLESGSRRRVELGPFYLVWENLESAQLRLEGDYGWPYQLVGVDLVRSGERFPRMAPPPGAPAPVRAGFGAFRIHCSRCHALNGEGGSIGADLNQPRSPVEYRERAWLRRWIDDPARILATARMPRLNPALPDRERVIGEILDYLEAMARRPTESADAQRASEAAGRAAGERSAGARQGRGAAAQRGAAERSAGPRKGGAISEREGPAGSGAFQAFYESAWQHPVSLWAAALLGLALCLARRGLDAGLRAYCLGLVALSLLDAWLTSSPVWGVGVLEGAAARGVPLFFVLAGDLRYWLLLQAAGADGRFRPGPLSLAVALGLMLIVPLASQAVLALLPGAWNGPRVLFLCYELLFVALVLGLLRWHPKLRPGSWLRSVTRFVLLYYTLWAAADAVILGTGADLGHGLRLLPNWLYYGGLVPAVAWLAPAGDGP